MWLLRRLLRRASVPVVVQLNEICGPVPRLFPRLSRILSHLDGVSGVIAISSWLSEWAGDEAARIGGRVVVLELPILVDTAEIPTVPYPERPRTFVYATSSNYIRDARYVLRAMRTVWHRHPDCRLVVTGMEPTRVARVAAVEGERTAITDGRIIALGHVDRHELLALYA